MRTELGRFLKMWRCRGRVHHVGVRTLDRNSSYFPRYQTWNYWAVCGETDITGQWQDEAKTPWDAPPRLCRNCARELKRMLKEGESE